MKSPILSLPSHSSTGCTFHRVVGVENHSGVPGKGLLGMIEGCGEGFTGFVVDFENSSVSAHYTHHSLHNVVGFLGSTGFMACQPPIHIQAQEVW